MNAQPTLPDFVRRSARKAAIGLLSASGLLVDVFAGFGGGSIASERAHPVKKHCKIRGFIATSTGGFGKISESERDANPNPTLTRPGPVEEAQAMAEQSLFAPIPHVNSRQCALCGKNLRSDNRSGYCRNHTPRAGGFAYGRCDCGKHLGRENQSGKCKVCKMQKTGRINGGKPREKNAMWRGGRFKNDKGYIKIKMRDHHLANGKGYVCEHVLVAEKAMGRLLTSEECVHHVNEVRDDNRPENLWVFANVGYHSAFHKWGSMAGLVWRGDGGACA